jgi:hypothetical protein
VKKKLIFLLVCCLLSQTVLADYHLSGPEMDERMELLRAVNRCSSALYPVRLEQMLNEASFAVLRLKLHAHYPLTINDVRDHVVALPYYSLLTTNTEAIMQGQPDTIYGAHIFDATFPRASRINALKVGAYGRLDTENYSFSFAKGRLLRILGLNTIPEAYYGQNLAKLIGQSSLIDTNGAYQLATQWLAAVDIDMTRLNKLKWTVKQLRFLPLGATNTVTLPYYYVDFGSRHHSASGNFGAWDEPLIEVKVLGTNKHLEDLSINDMTLSKRPPLVLTNILDLAKVPIETPIGTKHPD